jgi:AhpD family alkylhydroperoxidase
VACGQAQASIALTQDATSCDALQFELPFILRRLSTMSTFDHAELIQNINENLAPFRKTQAEAMQGFGQLARASMAEGAISAKNKELIALAIGITQHCSGCVGFHVKALRKLGCTREELEEMLTICVYMGGGPALMYSAEALKAWDALA